MRCASCSKVSATDGAASTFHARSDSPAVAPAGSNSVARMAFTSVDLPSSLGPCNTFKPGCSDTLAALMPAQSATSSCRIHMAITRRGALLASP